MTTPHPLPELEAYLLCNSVAEALDFATDGAADEGYLALAYGLQRARVMAEDEPWGPVLVARWELALHNYASEHLGLDLLREPD